MKNKNNKRNNLLSYLQNHLSNKEKHRYERKMMQDAFEYEAEEGLSQLNFEELKDDLKELKHKIEGRTNTSRIFILKPVFKYAAIVIIVLGFSGFLYLYILNQLGTKSSITGLEPESESKELETKSFEQSIISESNESTKDYTPREEKSVKGIHEERRIIAEKKGKEKGSTTGSKPDEKKGRPIKAAKTPEALDQKSVEMTGSISKQNEISLELAELQKEDVPEEKSAEDQKGQKALVPSLPKRTEPDGEISGYAKSVSVSADSQLHVSMIEEAVVTSEPKGGIFRQKGSKISDLEIETSKIIFNTDTSKNIIQPLPVIGIKQYELYLYENAVLEKAGKDSSIIKSVVSFEVDLDGKPDNIRVLGDSDPKIKEKTIRLINEGPLWKPATKNGKPFIGAVKVIIVYR